MPTYTLAQVRGVLLEEAIAALLSRAGFEIVSVVGADPTLVATGAGVAVRGRGTRHQIDVIADFKFTSPFSHPNRLLVEGKFVSDPVGLGVVRSVAAALRDAAEWFNPSSKVPASRYHYQAAIFSASGFTKPAEQYAYAHDIFLVPLAMNSAFQPVVSAIGRLSGVEDLRTSLTLGEVRSTARAQLLGQGEGSRSTQALSASLNEIHRAVDRVGAGYLARTSGGFPLFLVPQPDLAAAEIGNRRVRVRYARQEGWWLETEAGQPLFSFDLPRELFKVFLSDGLLDRHRALDMKEQQFDSIHAYRFDGERVQTMVLSLDGPWIQEVRQELDQ